MQIGRNLLDAVDGFLLNKTHQILDREPGKPLSFGPGAQPLIDDTLRSYVVEHSAPGRCI